MLSLFKRANNPLHKAIIDNDLETIKELAHDEKYLLSRDELNLTPLELACYLKRDDVINLINPKQEEKFKVLFPGESEIQVVHASDFKTIFKVDYTPHLYFPTYKDLKETIGSLPLTYPKNNLLGRQYEHEINTGYRPNLKIRWVDNIFGYGLFADEDLSPRQFIGEYVGEMRKLCRLNPKLNAYCFHYPTRFFSLKYHVVDASNLGNELRFINHSDIPNLTPFNMTINGMIHIILMTNRTIKKDEQLTFDYGKDYWQKRQKITFTEP